MKDEGYCFACGEENPFGLHLKFEFEGDRLISRKILTREYQGYENIAHGGIVMTMLDEMMSKFIQKKYNEQALTGKLEIRYRHPTPIGNELKLSAWVNSQMMNIITMKSKVETAEGLVTAEATAKFAVVASNEKE